MKLEAVEGNSIFLTRGRDIFCFDETNQLSKIGRLPIEERSLERFRTELKTNRIIGSIRRFLTGRLHSVNLWPVTADILIANVLNHVFRSTDGGTTWELVFTLDDSSGIRGILPDGVCYANESLYIGEYIFDEDRDPRIYRSTNLGQTWTEALRLEETRHIHSIQRDPFSGDLWVTTGDRDEESKIGRIKNGELETIGTGSQLWRTVGLVFTDDAILWGTDSSYQDNHIVRINRRNIPEPSDPEVLTTVSEPFYYSTSIDINDTQIVLFSTGGGYGTDSTAPDSVEQVVPSSKSIGIYGSTSESGFNTWIKLGTYQVKKYLADRLGFHSFGANGYVFLDSSPQRGIVINPYNTSSDDGSILIVDRSDLVYQSLETAFEQLRPIASQ